MQGLQHAPGHSELGNRLRGATTSCGDVGLEQEVVAAAHGCVLFPMPLRQGFGGEPGGAAQAHSEGARVPWVWWPPAAAMTAPVMVELGHGVSQTA